MSEPRGVLLGIFGGGVPPILQILTLFQTKKISRHYSDKNADKKKFL